ncbi:MAG: hypothetical protein MJ090_00890 [Clostridia bacterium]|nr:hypothetical protein [Clostridia bacterium]
MLPSAKKIKVTAKDILCDNFFENLIVCSPFVFSLAVLITVCGILNGVTFRIIGYLIEAVLAIFLILPLLMGTVRYFLRKVDGAKDIITSVFYYFSDYKKYYKVMNFLSIFIGKLFFSAFLFSIPSMVLNIFATSKFYEMLGMAIPLWTPLLSTVSLIILIFTSLAFFLYNLKYYLSVYLFVLDDEISIYKTFNLSAIISRRTKIDFLFLAFSMIIYVLLSFLFLPLLFTLPIIITVYIIHSKCAVTEYNNTIDLLNSKFQNSGF